MVIVVFWGLWEGVDQLKYTNSSFSSSFLQFLPSDHPTKLPHYFLSLEWRLPFFQHTLKDFSRQTCGVLIYRLDRLAELELKLADLRKFKNQHLSSSDKYGFSILVSKCKICQCNFDMLTCLYKNQNSARKENWIENLTICLWIVLASQMLTLSLWCSFAWKRLPQL